jgi:hypothetical protein
MAQLGLQIGYGVETLPSFARATLNTTPSVAWPPSGSEEEW